MREFELSDGKRIPEGQTVRLKTMNHIVEVMSILNESSGFQKIKKLSKSEYVLLETGEVLQYKLSDNRGQNVAGLKETFRKVRDLINNNFIGGNNELHLTLTYAENMTDVKRLYVDFKSFWMRYTRRYGNVDYLSVVEPQGRGAWHCHVLMRHNGVREIFIPADEVEKLWSHGFVKVRGLFGVDNIGAYLSAYLADVELTDETSSIAVMHHLELKEVSEGEVKKAYIKGGRLWMYPPGMNLYRHSKGIEFPEVQKVAYEDAKKIVGSHTPNYSRTVRVLDDGRVLNEITYEQYNLRREL